MKKDDRSPKAIRYKLARARYSAKRRSSKWKYRKKTKKVIHLNNILRERRQKRKPFISLEAPRFFSLIENTNEVLAYFQNVEKLLGKGENITLDISEVDELTPPTIALMVANLNDVDFNHKGRFNGNEPKNPDLAKLFRDSGFYGHVNSTRGFIPSSKNNLLHKEVHRKVETEVATSASKTGMQHVFGSLKQAFGDNRPFDSLYEILIEAMSNTNNHANLNSQGKCHWWLYVYCDPKQKMTSYSFLDLGVGIFKSAVVQTYFKKIFKGTVLYKNINLVDDLLSGKIQSRDSGVDQEIRGKGIPQIVDHAKAEYYRSFYIITNDVKMNLKTGEKEELSNKLNGTFLYWELTN